MKINFLLLCLLMSNVVLLWFHDFPDAVTLSYRAFLFVVFNRRSMGVVYVFFCVVTPKSLLGFLVSIVLHWLFCLENEAL